MRAVRQMGPTRIGWLQGLSLPLDWSESKLKYVAPGMQAGEAITADSIEPKGTYPVYGGNGLRGYTEAKTHQGTHILIGRQGALCGNVHLVSGEFWASEHAIVARPAATVEARWLAHLLQVMNLGQYSQTAAQPGIGTAQINALAVPVPPFREQHAIADYLDRETARIDTLIEEQQRLIEMLHERREAVIGAAFLNAQAQQPLKRVVPDITVGIVVQPSRWYVEDGVPALRGLNINRGSISTRDLVYISAEGDDANSKSRLRGGDVVVVRTGQAGAAAKVPESLDGANAIDILIIRPGTGTDADFLVWYLNSPVAASHIKEGSVGAIQGHFNVGALRELPFPTVSLNSQRRIAADLDTKVAAIDALIAETGRFIELSRERRAALITAAVTGQIDVREVV
ncbi:restriction endonuclease subunit S [Streptosporangium sandarakinum]